MLRPGTEEVRELFQQRDGVAMLNHGAFGLSPHPVLERRIELLKEQERLPDLWFRVNAESRYMKAVKAAADFVDCDFEDIFLVDNATTGVNIVLKSVAFVEEDEILISTHTYLGVKNTVEELRKRKGISLRLIDIPIPLCSEEQLVDLYERALAKYPKIKIAILDHITSPSALVFPIETLIELCKKHNVMTLIDGAHAPGQIKLHLRDLKADFYVGNFHKWAYSSRSCALLWIAPRHRDSIVPLVTSNFSGFSMHHRFGYQGTRDTSNHFTLPEALEFYESLGGLTLMLGVLLCENTKTPNLVSHNLRKEALKRHADKLLTWSQSMLCEALGTKALPVPKAMEAPFMRVIALPPVPEKYKEKTPEELIVHMCLTYGVQVAFYQFNDLLWLRYCANVYNKRDDYLKLKDALLDMFAVL